MKQLLWMKMKKAVIGFVSVIFGAFGVPGGKQTLKAIYYGLKKRPS